MFPSVLTSGMTDALITADPCGRQAVASTVPHHTACLSPPLSLLGTLSAKNVLCSFFSDPSLYVGHFLALPRSLCLTASEMNLAHLLPQHSVVPVSTLHLVTLKLALSPTDPRGRESGRLPFRESADTGAARVGLGRGWCIGEKRLPGQTWSPNPVRPPATAALVRVTTMFEILLQQQKGAAPELC